MSGSVIDRLVVNLGLDPSNFEKGQKESVSLLKKIEEEAVKSNKAVAAGGKSMGQAFDTAAKGALGLFAVISGGKGLEDLLVSTAQTDAAIRRLSMNLDISAQKLATWENAARAAGSSKSAMDSTLSNVSQAMVSMDHAGQSPLRGVLNQLHIGYQNADGTDMDPTDFLMQLAGKFQGMDPKQVTYLTNAMSVDPSIRSMLELGQGGLQKLINENQSNLDPTTVKDAEDVNAALGALETSGDNLKNTFLKQLTPAIVSFASSMTTFTQNFQNSSLYKTLTSLSTPPVPTDKGMLNTTNDAVGDAGRWVHHWGEKLLSFPSSSANPIPTIGDFMTALKNGTGGAHSNQAKAILAKGLAYFQSPDGGGFTGNQAAGIMAQIPYESRYDPNLWSAPDKDGRRAYGLFQWRGARQAQLFAEYGPNPTADQQIAFYAQELAKTEKATATKLRNTKTAFSASILIDSDDQRSGDDLGKQMLRGATAGGIAVGMTQFGVPPTAEYVVDDLRYDNAAKPAIPPGAAYAKSLIPDIPLSVQLVLAGLRKNPTSTVTVNQNVKIDAKHADASGVAKKLGRTTAATIHAARANTGLF